MPEKILIVDDDIDTLRLVGITLERYGYRIIAASNGQKALSLAKDEQPDLILLDIMMPGIDGYEVIRQLRSAEDTQYIPVIMFTAKAQVEDKVQGFEAGADDFLTKPTHTRELLARVKAVLSRTTKSLDPATVNKRSHMLAVIAPKGGVGVTTVALNLAIAIRKNAQEEVILADFRPGQGSLSLELGFSNPEGLNRLLQREPAEISRHAVEVELVHHNTGIRLLLSSPHPRDAQYSSSASQFEAIARTLHHMARYVVLDLGPGLNTTNEKVLGCCDEVFVILEPVPQTVLQGKALIQDLIQIGLGEGQIQAFLVNRVRSTMQLTLSQVQEQLGHKILTIATPEPELAFMASSRNIPMIIQQPEGMAAKHFSKLAADLSQRSG
jgi:DNA-binding response OmpR family regulator